MRIDFKKLEDYLEQYGYPRNELMTMDYFDIPEMSSYEYTMKNIAKFTNYDAMTFYGNRISYKKLSEHIDRTADAVKSLGLKEEQRIATLLPNIPEALYMQYGPSKIGVTVSNIDPRTNAQQLLKYVAHEKISAIVVVDVMYDSAIRPIERDLKDQYNIDKIVIVPASNSLPFPLKMLKQTKNRERIKSDIIDVVYWDDLIRNSRYEHALNVGYQRNRIAVIQHSSGTSSGLPKSIPLTHENINSFVEKHRPTEFGSIPPGTKLLHVLPYFAAYGSINSAHLGINLGLTLQEIPEFSFRDFGLLVHKHKSQIVIGVPNWFNAASKDHRLDGKDFSQVIMAISGGDSNTIQAKKEDDEFLISHGAKCIETNGHGMSEIGGSGSYTFKGHQHGLGIGIPFPYDKYVIIENGKIVPMGAMGVRGEAYIYSPSATDGMFDGEKIVDTIDIEGFRFINSKDTIHISPNYEMEFISREDRTFTRYDGHKIIPADIERKITENTIVKNCMVVPYEDKESLGKMPIAYIVPMHALTDDAKMQVISKITNGILSSVTLTSRDLPKKYCFLSELPQNKMSKNDYNQLINRELDGSEFTVMLNETNLKINDIKIVPPSKK